MTTMSQYRLSGEEFYKRTEWTKTILAGEENNPDQSKGPPVVCAGEEDIRTFEGTAYRHCRSWLFRRSRA